VLTVLDMPQALALALRCKVKLHVKDEESGRAWEWTVRLQESLGSNRFKIRTGEE
jgi:hypothetical protein